MRPGAASQVGSRRGPRVNKVWRTPLSCRATRRSLDRGSRAMDGRREPAPCCSPPPGLTFEVMIKMQTFAAARYLIQVLALAITHEFIGPTDFDCGKNADQSFRYAVRLGDRASDLLLVGDARRQITNGPVGPPRLPQTPLSIVWSMRPCGWRSSSTTHEQPRSRPSSRARCEKIRNVPRNTWRSKTDNLPMTSSACFDTKGIHGVLLWLIWSLWSATSLANKCGERRASCLFGCGRRRRFHPSNRISDLNDDCNCALRVGFARRPARTNPERRNAGAPSAPPIPEPAFLAGLAQCTR